MTPEQLHFLKTNVLPLETALLAHPIGSLFSGDVYLVDDTKLTSMQLLPGFQVFRPEEVARLFIAPDESVLRIKQTPERDDGAPEGIEVISDYPYLQEDRPASVIAYDEHGGMVRINSLHLKSLMLDALAPDRFATVAIGLMACTAYRLGFKKISLFAAGNGPLDDAGEFIGYAIWPRMGFDAPLYPIDLLGAAHLVNCTTVGEVIGADPQWWDENGTGRDMEFDLSAGSRSWIVLLDYVCTAIF